MQKINEFLKKLREFHKVHDKLIKGSADVYQADKKLDELIMLLENEEVKSTLDKYIQESEIDTQEDLNEVVNNLNDKIGEIIEEEKDMLQSYGVKAKEIEEVYNKNIKRLQNENDMYRFEIPKTSEEVKQSIIKFHQLAKHNLSDSQQKSRKTKKQRKKNLRRASACCFVGVGTFVVNIFLPALAKYSVVIGWGAVNQGIIDAFYEYKE
jgi:Fe2+ transport system protein B